MVSEVQGMPTKMTFLLADEVRETLQRMAREQRRSMTGVIEYLILNPDEASVKQIRDAYEKGREKGYQDAQEEYEEKMTEEYERGCEEEREKVFESDEYEEKMTAEYERGYEEGREAAREGGRCGTAGLSPTSP